MNRNNTTLFLLFLILFLISVVSGCIKEILPEFDEPSGSGGLIRVTVNGTVIKEADNTPLAEADINLWRRSLFEDWEWGGYEYEYVKSVTADTGGRYKLSFAPIKCNTWVYIVSASKATDSLRYFSGDHSVSCNSAQQQINITVKSRPITH